MSDPQRYAFVIGAAKCGTTALFSLLSQHPEVCPCTVKEPSYFAHPERYARGPTYYRGLWRWKPSHKIALEASPNYTKQLEFPGVVERLAQHPGEKLFIYIVRDPIERVESHYVHARSSDWGQDYDLRSGLHPVAVDICRYASQLEPYIQTFGKDRICVLNFDEFREKPELVAERVFKFLRVDSDFRVQVTHMDRNRSSDLGRDRALVRRLRRLPWAERMIRLTTPRRLRSLLKLVLQHSVERQRLSADQRKELRVTLAPELNSLAEVFGLDLSDWQVLQEQDC